LEKALKGAHCVFAVSIPEFGGAKRSEFEQGKLIADLALNHKVEQFIWSSLPNVQRESGGKYRVLHFTDKARVEEYVKTLTFKYTAFPMPAFYFENYLNGGMGPKLQNGEYIFKMLPIKQHPFCSFDVRDIGPAVLTIIKDPVRFDGMEIPLAAEITTPDEIVKTFSRISGSKAKLSVINPDKTDIPSEMVEMFQWFDEFGFFGERDAQLGKKYFKLKSWEEFIREEAIMDRLLTVGSQPPTSTGVGRMHHPTHLPIHRERQIAHQKMGKQDVNPLITEQTTTTTTTVYSTKDEVQ